MRLALDMVLKFYTSVVKGWKLKVRKFRKLNSTFVEVAWEKLVGTFLLPPSSIVLVPKVNSMQHLQNN